MIYEIYVISNSDLFREGLNAVAAFCQSDGFKTATWMGSAIGIIMTAMAYLKQHDVMVFLKWLLVYFFVFNILLGIPSTVAVINTSDQTVPAQVVDNVPFGIALPAHLITALGYGFSSDLETVFSLPNAEQYHKTGMLFGSNLFRLSLASQLDDPKVMNQMNSYVRSCVVGDILINHKYSFNDLLHSNDMWGLMTSQPSPIRGMFINGVFNTCSQAAKLLTVEINQYSSKTAPAILAKFIPTRNMYAPVAINNMLTNTYRYFKANSKTGTNILKQNMVINAFRSGIKNYAAETGSVAGMENIANTMAMNNTRIAWATSRHMGVFTLAYMQVVLLLLAICLFPLSAILSLIPAFAILSFKNQTYFLLWLGTWPIMYTILNMAINFYVSSNSHGSVTLSSINLLAQEHSDIAGVAGYLILAIPFLSFGIVKGMAFTFNNAAQYLGGMMHSIAQGSSTSVATGNYSLGNVSTDNATANNLSANKHDTNFTSMHGMDTQQLGNATTVTATPMGSAIYHTASGMSQLATGAHAAQSTVSSLNLEVGKSLTSASQMNTQYVQTMGHNEALGTNVSSGVSSHVDHAMSRIHSLQNSLATKEGIHTQDAFQKLSKASGGGSISLGGKPWDIGVGGNVGVEGSNSSSHEGTYSTGTDKNISASDAHDFRDALNTVKSYSQTHPYSDQNTDAQNIAIQMGTDLNNAERLSNSAQFIQSHSASINTNFSQAFANHMQTHNPAEANSVLSVTGNPVLLAKQGYYADRFIQTHAKQLASQFSSASADVQRGFDSPTMHDRQKYATQNYQQNSEGLISKGNGLGIKEQQSQNLTDAVRGHINQNGNKIIQGKQKQSDEKLQLQSSTDDRMSKGKSYAQKGVAHHEIDMIKEIL